MQRIAAHRMRISSAARENEVLVKEDPAPSEVEQQLGPEEGERPGAVRRGGHAPDEPRGDAHECVEECPDRREDLVGRGETGLGYARIPGGYGLGGGDAGDVATRKQTRDETCQSEPLIGRVSMFTFLRGKSSTR